MSEFIFLKSIDSTNSYLSSLLKNKKQAQNFLTVCSFNQTSGRGIYGSKWHSKMGKNITFSILFYPNIKPENNFIISMLTSLGICMYLKEKGLSPKIKWPNDIYIGNHKVCGILIENNVSADKIHSSIIGVGFNLNQREFPSDLPNPVSLAYYTGKTYSIKQEAKLLQRDIVEKLKESKFIDYEKIRQNYLKCLYRFNTMSRFKINNEIISARIIDVKYDGKVVIKNSKGKNAEFGFKEIEFVV